MRSAASCEVLLNNIVQAKLWYLQRVSAMLLVGFVVVHLVTLVYATRGGLTAAEILERTQGSVLAALFYGGFVVAAALHAPIGVARVAEEWLGLGRRASGVVAVLFGFVIVVTGLRAVYAVVAS